MVAASNSATITFQEATIASHNASLAAHDKQVSPEPNRAIRYRADRAPVIELTVEPHFTRTVGMPSRVPVALPEKARKSHTRR